MDGNPKIEARNPKPAGGIREIPFLTREELVDVLRISVRTVDAMIAAEEIPCVRMRETVVRFYLPDVVRHLTATVLTRKNGRRVTAQGRARLTG